MLYSNSWGRPLVQMGAEHENEKHEIWRNDIKKLIKILYRLRNWRKPKVNVLLLKGFSSSSDLTFQNLEYDLSNRYGEQVSLIPFSYTGFADGDVRKPLPYTLDDVISVSMVNHVAQVDRYVGAILSRWNVPLAIAAHSFGALTLMNWTCQPLSSTEGHESHRRRLQEIGMVCFLAGILFPPYPEIEMSHPERPGDRLTIVATPKGFVRARFFKRFLNEVVNMIGGKDDYAPSSYASLKPLAAQNGVGDRLLEKIIHDADHFILPGHEDTVRCLRDYIDRYI